MSVQPCSNAKKASGKLRFRGEAEYKCQASCMECHGYAWTTACPTCQGCGLLLGVICDTCRGRGRLPAKPQRSVTA